MAQMRAWRLAGLDFGYVAVNLSGSQLAEANLATTIERRLRDAQVSPHHLMLEITETVYLEDKDDTVRSTLRALRALGVAFALDDFGTGHASLSHLLKLEVDRIKIDMSFVRLIGKSAGTDAIVSAIVMMGLALELQVVAEGVETREQLAFLQRAGCKLIQGYLFAKPLDAESAGAFSAASNGRPGPGRTAPG
ncbi:MAG: EAL domain-containing protein [Proteobacteria bacterium]|nr:MAG: EAL domain-containing protein [Pseudomonadota bacterium]